MATVMTNAQRTHTDKILSTLEEVLTTVIDYGAATAERDQLASELTEIRAQRQGLNEAHSNEAYRWTKLAAARTKKITRKYAKALTAAATTREADTEQRRISAKKQRDMLCATTSASLDDGDPSPVKVPGHTDTLPLVLPYTNEHRELVIETTQLLLQRRARLHRSARVTTGRLHTAILTELHRVENDLYTLPRLSHRKSAACRDHHQYAEDQWYEHGADALIGAHRVSIAQKRNVATRGQP